MLNAKLASQSQSNQQTIVKLSEQVAFGGKELVIIGGPCTVESQSQMEIVAQELQSAPVQALRGGVFKPRTSPYAFQGLGLEGLEILSAVRQRYNIPVVTEVMNIGQIEAIASYVDMLQVGSRNMQNFDLLKALGEVDKPILLKRGLSATIEEFVMAAEYILSHGNSQVVLCERGIRSFDKLHPQRTRFRRSRRTKTDNSLTSNCRPFSCSWEARISGTVGQGRCSLWCRWINN